MLPNTKMSEILFSVMLPLTLTSAENWLSCVFRLISFAADTVADAATRLPSIEPSLFTSVILARPVPVLWLLVLISTVKCSLPELLTET